MASKRKAKAVVAKPKQQKTVAVTDVLSDKERLFIEMYFICELNGTEAALAVYDTTNRAVAATIAWENLRKPEIRRRVDARLDEYHLQANEVLARLAYHARGSMVDFIDPDSGTIDLKKAKEAKALGLIKRYKTKFMTTTKAAIGNDGEPTTEEIETIEIELELYDAQAALVHVGKHLNLFTDKSINLNLDLTKTSDEDLMLLSQGKIPAHLVGGK
jgi:phage terminase small subunit